MRTLNCQAIQGGEPFLNIHENLSEIRCIAARGTRHLLIAGEAFSKLNSALLKVREENVF